MLDQVAVLHPRAVFHGILVPLLSKLAFDSSSSSSSPPRLASVVVANNNISVGINVHQVSVLSRICQNALSTHDRLHLYLINLSSAISPSPPLQLSTMKKWNEVMIPFVQALLLGSSSSNNSHLSLSDCCEWTEDCFLGKATRHILRNASTNSLPLTVLAAMKLLESCFPQTTIKTSKKFSALLLAFLNQCVKMKNTFKISVKLLNISYLRCFQIILLF